MNPNQVNISLCFWLEHWGLRGGHLAPTRATRGPALKTSCCQLHYLAPDPDLTLWMGLLDIPTPLNILQAQRNTTHTHYPLTLASPLPTVCTTTSLLRGERQIRQTVREIDKKWERDKIEKERKRDESERERKRERERERDRPPPHVYSSLAPQLHKSTAHPEPSNNPALSLCAHV